MVPPPKLTLTGLELFSLIVSIKFCFYFYRSKQRLKKRPAGRYGEKKMNIVGGFTTLFLVSGPIFSKIRKEKMIY